MPIEFDKYEKYGAYHWQAFVDDPVYRAHALKVLDWLRAYDGASILDVGCGDGLITVLLGAMGVDCSAKAIKLAQEREVDAGVGDAYALIDFLNEQQLPGFYDAVFMGDVLEHLEFPEKALAEVAKITDRLYVTTPPRGETLSPYHYREWTPDELREFMAANGWREVSSEIANGRIYGEYERLP